MKKAVILHGTKGSPESNWFRWLESELHKQGLEVWLPVLPNPEQPSLRKSVDFVRANIPFDIDDQTLIIGHSSGAILALIYAQESSKKVGAVVAVSVFHDNSLNWDANNSLFDVSFDFPEIHSKIEKLIFIHSDDDPYVPVDQAQYVADSCQADIIVIKNSGHFNLEKSEAFKQFPQLIEILKQKNML